MVNCGKCRCTCADAWSNCVTIPLAGSGSKCGSMTSLSPWPNAATNNSTPKLIPMTIMNGPTNLPDLPTRCKTLWGATEPPFSDHVKKPFASPAFTDLTTHLEQLAAVRACGVVHGPNGVGKTLSVEHFLRSL